ncbi:MAG TPA: Pr6Pr family membrane protein [Actinomycetota bacterium]|nr:Pr6Pr family membrane protein [Actinomycetota bacterium]
MHTRGRWWFGLTALAALTGLIVQVLVVADRRAGFFDTSTERALNVFAFFTIQSNIIVGITSLVLALRADPTSMMFRVARLTGVVAIAITFVVFHVAIAHLFEFESWSLVADRILHAIVPILAVVGWLMYGPRALATRRVLWLSLVFPVAWCIFTLIRGALVGWYPYHFIDVGELGYAKVGVNCLWVAVLYLGVAAGLSTFDGWLARFAARSDEPLRH